MNWSIPAKTFLLGEYAAVAEASAIVLTTTPYFELSLQETTGLTDIHPQSPAGLWWQQQELCSQGLNWQDPYAGIGGLGASSAQFIGSYLASCSIKKSIATMDEMLQAYYQCAWTGTGLRPSGYDVIAQSQQGCVYINKHNKKIHSYSWCFPDLSFFLVHTGVKLATHHHLQDATLPSTLNYLSDLVDDAQQAFIHQDSSRLIKNINLYHEQLAALNLVAEHSLKWIEQFKSYPEVVATKGCGALGADILLLVCAQTDAVTLQEKLKNTGLRIIATEHSINKAASLL